MLSKNQLLNLNYQGIKKQEALVRFYDWITNKQIISLQQSQLIKNLFYKKYWDLEFGKYRQVSQTQLFSIVIQIRIQRLNISKNKSPNVIRQIKQVSFPLLTKIMLSDNHITSLEFLDHLDCPNLQAVGLMNNKITHIRSFKKTKFPNLNYLGLEKNMIQNFSSISMMQNNNFCQILLQVDNNDKILGNDISWISKINSTEFRELRFKNSSRINLQKTKKMLLNKFQELQFQDKYKIK